MERSDLAFLAPLIVRLTVLSRRNANALRGPRLSARFPNGVRNSPGPICPSLSILSSQTLPGTRLFSLDAFPKAASPPSDRNPRGRPRRRAPKAPRALRPPTFLIFPEFRPRLAWPASPAPRWAPRRPGHALREDPNVPY